MKNALACRGRTTTIINKHRQLYSNSDSSKSKSKSRSIKAVITTEVASAQTRTHTLWATSQSTRTLEKKMGNSAYNQSFFWTDHMHTQQSVVLRKSRSQASCKRFHFQRFFFFSRSLTKGVFACIFFLFIWIG